MSKNEKALSALKEGQKTPAELAEILGCPVEQVWILIQGLQRFRSADIIRVGNHYKLRGFLPRGIMRNGRGYRATVQLGPYETCWQAQEAAEKAKELCPC